MEVAYRLSIGTDLDDLERRNISYFAFFRRTRLLCWPITSQWI